MKAFLYKSIVVMLLLQSPMSSAEEQPPEAYRLVAETTDLVLAAVRSDHANYASDPRKLFSLIDSIILPHFDFERMSRWVLGKHWRRASDAQKSQFVREFRDLLVRTYSTALIAYAQEEVEVLPQRKARNPGEVIVVTEVRISGGFPVPIAYYMYETETGWKAFDVKIEGISLVANYRSSFSSRIRRDGLDKLIGLLAARNAQYRQ